jgi:hypothetical protein
MTPYKDELEAIVAGLTEAERGELWAAALFSHDVAPKLKNRLTRLKALRERVGLDKPPRRSSTVEHLRDGGNNRWPKRPYDGFDDD